MLGIYRIDEFYWDKRPARRLRCRLRAEKRMIRFLLRRVLTMAVTLLIISALVFFIIKLPPGDFLTNQIAELRAQGEAASAAKAEFLIRQYGLDRPVWEQYLVWIGVWPDPNGLLAACIQGDWGWSFEFDKPVNEVVGDALWLTLLVNFAVVIFVHIVAIPIAIYSATRQYSLGDYAATFIGYIGLATPSFLLALILLFYSNRWFGVSIGGLYDPAYAGQPWSWGKMQSLASHLVVPTLVIGLGGTAAMIRRMRANLLDELGKQYYVTAKAKGLPPDRALLKYPFRMSLNPFIADIGNLLPHLVSGSVLVSLVLSLPTVGPILLSGAEEPGPVPGRLHPDVRRDADGGRHADLRPAARLARSAHPARRELGDERRSDAPRRSHYVNPAPFDPGARRADRRARASSFYRASSLAADVVEVQPPQGGGRLGAVLLLAFYLDGAVRRGHRALQPDQAPRRLPLRAAAGACICSTRAASSGPFVYPYKFTFNLETFQRDYVVDRTTPQPMRFLCRGDAYEFWGVIDGDFHLVCPPKDGTMLPARHRPARARPVLAHHLRGADLAHRSASSASPCRSRSGCSSAASPAISAAGSITSIQRADRDPALAARAAAVARALGGAAAELEPDPRLLRHHDHPRPARLAGPRARGALEAPVAARGGFRARRRADGRLEAAHHRAPPDPELHEPPDRLGDAVDPVDDPRRDRAVLPRASACGRR